MKGYISSVLLFGIFAGQIHGLSHHDGEPNKATSTGRLSLIVPISVTIQMPFSNDLNDSSSNEYKQLSTACIQTINGTFGQNRHNKGITFRGFRKGSVICDLDLLYEAGSNQPCFRQYFNSSITGLENAKIAGADFDFSQEVRNLSFPGVRIKNSSGLECNAEMLNDKNLYNCSFGFTCNKATICMEPCDAGHCLCAPQQPKDPLDNISKIVTIVGASVGAVVGVFSIIFGIVKCKNRGGRGSGYDSF